MNGNQMDPVSSYIDHTLLKPTASYADLTKLCEEARTYRFVAVCIPPSAVELARRTLDNSPVKVATVIGFPFGYNSPNTKLMETEEAIADGADELDMVINLIDLKSGSWSSIQEEMDALISLAHRHRKLVKVIIETGVLSNAEVIRCCQLLADLGADFLKTSTGFAEKGASVEIVRLMREHLPPSVRIKASGGIRTFEFAKELIDAGAARLGTSAGKTIVEAAALAT